MDTRDEAKGLASDNGRSDRKKRGQTCVAAEVAGRAGDQIRNDAFITYRGGNTGAETADDAYPSQRPEERISCVPVDCNAAWTSAPWILGLTAARAGGSWTGWSVTLASFPAQQQFDPAGWTWQASA